MPVIQEFTADTSVLVNGQPVKITSGITPLGELNIGDQIKIQVVTIKTEPKIYGLVVDEKTKDITQKKNIGSQISTDKETTAYNKNITVLGAQFPHTKADQNYLAILETFDDGKVKFWELGVVNQGTKFFFVVQKVYKLQCYASDGTIQPYSNNKEWPQLFQLLKEIYENNKNYLPSLLAFYESLFAFYENEKKENIVNSKLQENEGVVLWWNFRRNSGAIMTKKGAAKIYWNNIKSGESPTYLVPYSFVKFETLVKPTHRTELEWEAIGVKELPLDR